jgi:hypothetical protein
MTVRVSKLGRLLEGPVGRREAQREIRWAVVSVKKGVAEGASG